jgi:hypothetical protein
MARVSRIAKRVWKTSPEELFQRIAAGPRPKAPYAPWLNSKHGQWARLVYYLDAFRALSARAGRRFEMGGKRVLEIGSGPVLGFGPLALVEGARSFAFVDPGYQEVRDLPGFEEDYLYPLHSMHGAVHGPTPREAFPALCARVRQIQANTKPIESLTLEAESFDLVVSKSCLEHIADLTAALEVIRLASAPGSLHLHYVDFTMHYDVDRVGSPFGTTYQRARRDNPEYFGNVRSLLNLLRPSDVRAAFGSAWSELHFFPLLDLRGRVPLSGLHADWQGYSDEDLTTANAIYLAVR